MGLRERYQYTVETNKKSRGQLKSPRLPASKVVAHFRRHRSLPQRVDSFWKKCRRLSDVSARTRQFPRRRQLLQLLEMALCRAAAADVAACSNEHNGWHTAPASRRTQCRSETSAEVSAADRRRISAAAAHSPVAQLAEAYRRRRASHRPPRDRRRRRRRFRFENECRRSWFLFDGSCVHHRKVRLPANLT